MTSTTVSTPPSAGTPAPQGSSTSAPRDPKRRKRILMAVGGALVAFVFLAPYLVMVLDSLRTSSDVKSTPATILPKVWQWDTYAQVLGDERFLAWLKTSLIVAAGSTVIVIVVAIPAAFMTARHRFPGRGAFLLLVLVTQMFAPTSLVVGLYRQFFELNMINTYGALIITNAAFNLAFAIWILHGFFASIPLEVEEAAALDGAGRWQVLRRVMLPLTLPGLVTATIFTFIAAWNEYVVALTLMIDDDKKPLTVGMRAYITGYEQHWDQLFAASVIAVVPVVILFAIIEKHLVGGLTAGSVK
ncbi:carbohydrate ABC transporter permease [Terrabacter sp. MAHUQ-38]|uniref:carbohydrate ABC transporter permease n=1 Tax=unclassified Terrabacter TaxID=2630222 RepID=UPI00165E3A9B|nr:carbohydrate ABC transporter permease [Terrabacter sp. MAHUQ-38]MBC9820230.1 carbohydrate ABC transporter permease [Terrabacter sp. MAHUQ-38]